MPHNSPFQSAMQGTGLGTQTYQITTTDIIHCQWKANEAVYELTVKGAEWNYFRGKEVEFWRAPDKIKGRVKEVLIDPSISAPVTTKLVIVPHIAAPVKLILSKDVIEAHSSDPTSQKSELTVRVTPDSAANIKEGDNILIQTRGDQEKVKVKVVRKTEEFISQGPGQLQTVSEVRLTTVPIEDFSFTSPFESAVVEVKEAFEKGKDRDSNAVKLLNQLLDASLEEHRVLRSEMVDLRNELASVKEEMEDQDFKMDLTGELNADNSNVS